MDAQWKLFEKLLIPLFWISLFCAFLSLGFAIWLWPNIALRFSLHAMAIGFVALAISVKAYSVAASKSS